MLKHSTSPAEIVLSLWRNRNLVIASAKRDVLGRYRGSAMGILWSVFNPLFMLAVYTFVFSVVFQARWGGASNSKVEFALVLFAGLMMFNLFAECITRAPELILSNANYVKKVVYPLEILPVISLLSALFHLLTSLCVWVLAHFLFIGALQGTIVYLPLIILPFSMFILGFSWLLASLGVFLRDISQMMGVITTVLMFMTPIFYPVNAIPENYRRLLSLNPLTPVIETTRDLLYWGKPPSLSLLCTYWLVASAIGWLGFVWFQKTRRGFSDVL